MNLTSSPKKSSMGRSIIDHCARCKQAVLVAGRDRVRLDLLGLISALLVLLTITAWSYRPTIADLLRMWQGSKDYSAGQLVPLVALFFVWVERKNLGKCVLKPCWLWGVLLIVLAQAARIYGLLFMFDSVQNYSLALTVAGLVLMVTGWQVFRRVSWILLFLFLMYPLPGRVHNMVSGPLQRLATSGSVFILEAVLPQVSQQGNVVMLNENTPMAVAEACSGLRMLTAFIIVAGFVAYMVKRARWQKAVLLVSSIPVAVACNVIRIVVTAILMLLVSTEVGEKFFHDFAGLVMMPAAVLLLFGEIWLMDRLVVPEGAVPQESTSIVTRKRDRR
jgi:exosortase